MDCWNKILKDEGPRAFFKVCLWINQYKLYVYLFFSGQFHKCTPVHWLRACACGIRRVHCSVESLRLARQQCQHHQRPRDKIWSCCPIKIMSQKPPTCNTSLKTSDSSLSNSIMSIICGLTHQYLNWQTRVLCLIFAKKKFGICQESLEFAKKVWHLPRKFTTSKVLCLHQIVRIQSDGINCATWIRFFKVTFYDFLIHKYTPFTM